MKISIISGVTRAVAPLIYLGNLEADVRRTDVI